MSYQVRKDFIDTDTGIFYQKGDEYPTEVEDIRLRSLLAKTSKMRHESLQGEPLIEEVSSDGDLEISEDSQVSEELESDNKKDTSQE